MKPLWSAVSFLAVVHLLALLMFGGWLWSSGRLSRERINAVRDVFALTVEEEQTLLDEQAAQDDRQRAAAREAALRDDPPVASDAQVVQFVRLSEREQQSIRRMEDEKQMLLEQIRETAARIDAREQTLQEEREAWEEAIATDRQRKTDEQFQQVVRQLESVPPKLGKDMIIELVGQGERAQAVAYLDSMQPRAVTKILREFKTDAEIKLATELLEELRTFGLGRTPDQDLSNDDVRTNPAADEA